MIGFHDEQYNVTEGMGMFTDITVGLLVGELGQEVVVQVNTQAGTAKGKFRYTGAILAINLDFHNYITFYNDLANHID